MFLTIYDDFMLCKVTLGALKGASKLNVLLLCRQGVNKPCIIDRASPSLLFKRQPHPASQPRPPPSQAAGSGHQRPRAGSWGDAPPHKRRQRQLRGEGEACDSEKHLFTKDGCFLPTPQLTPEPTGSAVTVSHASLATYRQAVNKPCIIDRASPSLPLKRQPLPAYQPRPPPSQAAASGQQRPRAAGS